MSALTLGLAVERLPRSVWPVADPPDDPDFNQQTQLRNNINRASQRFHDESVWSGKKVQVRFTAFEDANEQRVITLPRHLNSMIRGGLPGGGRIIPTQGQWYQYMPNSVGPRRDTDKHWGPAQDLGTGFTTYRDITTAGQLTITTDTTEDGEGLFLYDDGTDTGTMLYDDGVDNGQIEGFIAENPTLMIIRALDGDGEKIYTSVGDTFIEGIAIDLADAPVTTSQTVSRIYGLFKPITRGYVRIAVGATEVARMDPGERVANYRRYLVGFNGVDQFAFQAICYRRHVWAYSANDPIYPDNLEAIKNGLIALNYEERADLERSQQYWAIAYRTLNMALKDHEAGIDKTLQYAGWAGGRHLNMT